MPGVRRQIYCGPAHPGPRRGRRTTFTAHTNPIHRSLVLHDTGVLRAVLLRVPGKSQVLEALVNRFHPKF
jgi:hypothetical protein